MEFLLLTVYVLLVVLFFVSIGLFLRRILIFISSTIRNHRERTKALENINKNLEKLIATLEKNNVK